MFWSRIKDTSFLTPDLDRSQTRASSRRAFPGFPVLSNTAYSLGWLVGRSSLAARGFVSSSGPKIRLAKEIEMNRPTIARTLRVGALTIGMGEFPGGAFPQ